MESLPTYTLLARGSPFAVLDPFATVPRFLAMTGSNAGRAQTGIRVAGIVVLYAGIVLAIPLAAVHLHRLGETPIEIGSRMMGRIPVAVSVQLVVDGIRGTHLLGWPKRAASGSTAVSALERNRARCQSAGVLVSST